MAALPDDIAAVSRDAIVVTWYDAAIAARYPSARDGSETPSFGCFDSAADAATVIAARGSLIGTDRRRFAVSTAEVVWPDLATLPSARLIDVEHSVDTSCLQARLELDLEAENTNFELFG
jgi:hypothetical protein